MSEQLQDKEERAYKRYVKLHAKLHSGKYKSNEQVHAEIREIENEYPYSQMRMNQDIHQTIMEVHHG